MNNFCVNLNLPVTLFVDTFDIDQLKLVPHLRLDQTDLNPKLLVLLDNLGLKIELVEVFFRRARTLSQIHRDIASVTDATKINWVYDGAGSVMHWYDIIENNIYTATSAIGISYQYYKLKDLKLAHSQTIGYPSLIQVAVPHNIIMSDQDRLCISIIPKYKNTNQFPTFQESVELFQNFQEISA